MKQHSISPATNGDSEKKKAIIEAIKTRDIEKLKLLVGKKVILNSFFDALKFTSNPNHNIEDAVISGDLEKLMEKIINPY